MSKLFEPVLSEQTAMPWEYCIRMETSCKGYYHWHQSCELLFVHEGSGTVVVNRQIHDIGRGKLFLFQPRQLHYIHVEAGPDTPYIFSVCYPDAAFLEKLLRPFPRRHAAFMSFLHGRGRKQSFDLSARVPEYEGYLKAYDRIRWGGRGEEPEELTLLFLQLLTCLEDGDDGQSKGPPAAKTLQRYSETIMQWIEVHFHEDVTLERLSEETRLSTAYISRIFRRETGSSITDYLAARRIQHACRLLESTDLAVEQVGIQSGLPNPSYFIQLFKKEIGTTPLQYRNSLSRRALS